ncbi:arylsulfatase A-like enzyme [Microterricola gilva]|uniref:Arylsulfatase A-like enzyme n=1 Tax=Microterricola gilva TaxID=393267 RepID=A0A4Q8AJD8_9MICO|nr:sulfatase-like hydrolase/transferase [Microterricola gilva]RZU63889.1 arylsulfatase A-like enzyme [Microterricola gilva]
MHNTDRKAPNVVVIYADDLGYGDISAFGSGDIRTPHLDALAARGLRLTNWYSNSPVCSPSRASLLTGKYPTRAGVEEILGGHRGMAGMPAQQTMADHLQAAGYRTGIFGKWHLGTDVGFRPADRGFTEHYGFLAGCVDYYSHIFYWAEDRNPIHDLWQDGQHIFNNGRYLTEVLAEEASAFIERSADAPFFCYVPFNAPHYPMHAPREYVDRFPELPEGRRIIAAMISAMDDGIGRIVDTLRTQGILDDTIIFFSSDNGPSAESRNWLDGEEISYTGGSTGGLRGHKGSVFEGGIRVPSLLSWPNGLPQGADFTDPAAMMDVLPTLLDAINPDAAAGTLAVDHIDGKSLLAALRGSEQAEEPRELFWEYEGQSAVRSGRWKLVRNPSERLGEETTPGESLYDLDTDPIESQDLGDRNPEVRAVLGASLDDWLAQMAATRELTPDLV